MEVKSAMASGLLAIRRGMDRIDGSSGQLASRRQMEEHPSPAAPLVEALDGRTHAQAGVEVMQTEDELLGTLLDEKA